MATSEMRRPVFAKSLERISWESHGAQVLLDPLLRPILNYSVYRYASLAEALAICKGRLTFARPSKWPDKYESHLADQLFADNRPFGKAMPFVKCFSLEYSSEAMWRTYSGSGGLIRAGMKLGDLIGGLNSARFPSKSKIYVGRVRYMDPARIRKEIRALNESHPKPVMNNAMPALLMKRAGFAFENEIRVAFLPPSRVNAPEIVVAQEFPLTVIHQMLLDPYLPKWQTDELEEVFNKKVKLPFKVKRSSFDEHPKDLSFG